METPMDIAKAAAKAAAQAALLHWDGSGHDLHAGWKRAEEAAANAAWIIAGGRAREAARAATAAAGYAGADNDTWDTARTMAWAAGQSDSTDCAWECAWRRAIEA